jgi:hypothetical protein
MLVVWTPPSFPSFEVFSGFYPSEDLWFNPIPDPSVLFEPLFEVPIYFFSSPCIDII